METLPAPKWNNRKFSEWVHKKNIALCVIEMIAFQRKSQWTIVCVNRKRRAKVMGVGVNSGLGGYRPHCLRRSGTTVGFMSDSISTGAMCDRNDRFNETNKMYHRPCWFESTSLRYGWKCELWFGPVRTPFLAPKWNNRKLIVWVHKKNIASCVIEIVAFQI